MEGPAVGDVVPVWVHGPDGRSRVQRGAVRLEDLTGTLERIATRSGPNGPQGPVTQWILAEAAAHLAEQLTRDIRPSDYGDSVPRVLSSLIGHEPFVKQRLGLSVHQMTRRWPQASDWYHDLIAYVMRPQRYEQNLEDVVGELPDWLELDLGSLVRAVGEFEMQESRDPLLYAVSDVIATLWPDHPQVQANHARVQDQVLEGFGNLYALLMPVFGLRLRDGVTIAEVVWSLQALASWDMKEESLRAAPTRYTDPVDGQDRPHHSRAAMVYLAGAVEREDGSSLTLPELYRLRPRVDLGDG